MKNKRKQYWGALFIMGILVTFPVVSAMAEEKPLKLEEMEVSAPDVPPTARPLPPHFENHPAAVTVITSEEIEESGITSGTEILKRVPGFNPQLSDTRGFFPKFSARGTTPAQASAVKVLVNGAPVGMNLSDPGARYYIPPVGDIERVEVIRGQVPSSMANRQSVA